MRLLKLAVWLMIGGIILTVLGLGSTLWVIRTGVDVISAGLGLPVAVMAGIGVGLLGLLGLVAGVFTYVFVPVVHWDLAGYRYGSHTAVLSALAVVIIISTIVVGIIELVGTLVPSLGLSLMVGENTPTILGLILMSGSLDLAMLLIVFLRVARPGVITWSHMGMTRASLGAPLGARVLLGLVAGVGMLGISAVLGFLLQEIGVESTQEAMFAAVQSASLPVFAVILFTVGILAPFAEEVFFRGYMFSAYRRQKGLWQAFVFSSAIFAVLHLSELTSINVLALTPFFVIGLVLAGVYHYSGSLVPAIVAHGLNNSVAMLLLYFGVS